MYNLIIPWTYIKEGVMQVNSVGYQQANINAFKQNAGDIKKEEKSEKSLEDTFEESAISVSISMGAQIVLFSMNSADSSKDNALMQGALDGNKEMFDFLSAKNSSSSFSLENIGYEGKPITELSVDEANDLLSQEGFFGINQTSSRVADFVLSFAGDDVELLKEGREGIVGGFEEAQKLFKGQLPEISLQTQERTLSLIDEKISSLNNKE